MYRISYTSAVYVVIVIRLLQVVRGAVRLADGVEFDDGRVVIRWHDEGMRSYDKPADLYGDAAARNAEVLGISPPSNWLRLRDLKEPDPTLS